ncbi:hypothetical protein [Patiriisocius sp. Uisw_017]|jgi:hypothetical protein|uniref:hypothetical protein n=1 Tax=Patiriisocius sp. Uisw_017 TaxID=3230968 RepID=UPI0039EBB005
MIIDHTFELGLPSCYNFGNTAKPVPSLFSNYPNTDNIPDDLLTPENEAATRDFAVSAIN